ncbi:MAG: ATP-binding protein [Caldisericia bacterium]|nr:ATP-binding protein [Caldisericia bacterium]MDD4614028.1 ATP-binding protein [Caldisericia bacterium]
MKCKQLQSLIYYGECNKIEFKQIPCEGMYKTICAFLNTYGGNLLVGVDDNGQITGYKPSKRDIEMYCEAISSWSDACIQDEVIRVGLRSVWVIQIESIFVQKPHASVVTWKGDTYVRIGNSTRRV